MRRDRVDHFICGHNGNGVAREIDVESGVHVVGNDQVEALCRARRNRRHVRAELDRATRAGWHELYDPEAVIKWEIGIGPPEPPLEFLRADDIREGNDHPLGLHIDFGDARAAGRVITTAFFLNSSRCSFPLMRSLKLKIRFVECEVQSTPLLQPLFCQARTIAGDSFYSCSLRVSAKVLP